MGRDAISLRAGRPEYGDGRHFARLMDQSAEGFFRFMLGRSAEDIIARAFSEPGHSLSYEHVMFAEQEGVVIGMSSGFTGVQNRGFSEEPLNRAAGRSAFRMNCVRTLFRPIWRILETVPEEDFYIQGLAVDPNLRGAGIGSLLMTDVEERAATSGSKRISLDVAASNKGARKLYARRGMGESSEWPKSRLLPTLFVRMSRNL